MNLEQLQLLVKKGESDTLEFKTSTSTLRAAFETTCAFLNSKGGAVLIGVTDAGKIIGQQIADKTRKEISEEIARIEPSAQAQINVEYVLINEDKHVIFIKIEQGSHAPYIYDGRPFYRVETTTLRMPQHRYEQLIVKRRQLNHAWDEFPAVGYNVDDLDHEEIMRTVKDAIDAHRLAVETLNCSVEEILQKLNLIKDGNLLNAAVVLYAKEINSPYRHCLMRMNRYRGQDKLGNFIDSQRVYGNAFKLLSEANYFNIRHLSVAGFFEPEQGRRIDQPSVPVMAVREALLNAIAHRDYTDRSASISFGIYDDRLEIWNNGALPPQLTISDLKHAHNSFPRNQLIADVFYTRGWVETVGVGTLRMIEECQKLGAPAPIFEEYSGGLSVTFKFKEPMGIVAKAEKQKTELSERQKIILSIIKKHNSVGIKQIMSELESPPSSRMVRKDLENLRTRGVIDLKGSKRGALWALK